MSTATTHVHARNRVRGPFNSWFLGLLEGYFDRRQGAVRRELLASARGVVAEIGAGNGPTFRYLPRGTELHAIEPNPAFHRRLREAADEHGIDLTVHSCPAEAIDLPDDSVDTVISSWVLCTVADTDAALAEIRRILKPGGRFLFVEHVAAPHASAVGRVQRAIRRPWSWVFEGCDVRRDTAATIRAAGFRDCEVEPVLLPTVFAPIRSQIAGVATA